DMTTRHDNTTHLIWRLVVLPVSSEAGDSQLDGDGHRNVARPGGGVPQPAVAGIESDATSGLDGPDGLDTQHHAEPKRKLKKAKKKKAPAVQFLGSPPTEALVDAERKSQALDERLDMLLSKKHEELIKKLENWMLRQEELILNIDSKIFGYGASFQICTDLGVLHEVEGEEGEEGEDGSSTKNIAKKALQKLQGTQQTFDSQASPSSSQVKMKQVVSAVARRGAAPQKQKSKLRNSREVQDFYMQQRIREMKKTRRHPNGPAETFRDRVADAITNPIFEMSCLALGLLSAVVVGIEVNWFAQNITATSPPLALTIINHVVSVIFTVELSMKIYVLQLRFFKVDISWHILDVVVVSTGLVELVIDLVNLMNTCENCSESGLDLGILRALRIARAVRLARLARLVQYIRELRRLIISVLATLKSVFWTIVLLALIIYTFAVIFQQAVNDYEQSVLRSNATPSSETEKFFPGLLRTAMTLLQTATGGLSWIEVESALSNISTLLVVTFLLYFSFIYFAVLNVVTGVFCSTAIENASQDAEAQIDEHVRKSKDYSDRLVKVYFDSIDRLDAARFEKMDTDNTGTISILEFEEMWEDPALQALLSTLGISQSKAWKLFEIMDEDDNGEINADEFVCLGASWGGENLRRYDETCNYMIYI
ncbi:unnamed protein product, partial [Cladocopium goreaui]